MSTELVVQGTYDLEIAQNAVDLVKEELGEDAKITFTRVKVPSGGSTAWEDPASIDPENPDPIKELRGVIVGHRKVSRLYFTSFDERGEGDSGRPDAWTNDGKIQVVPEETVDYCRANDLPVPLTDVSRCPYHQFGSAHLIGKSSKGKATNDYLDLFVLIPGLPLPVQLSVSSASIKPAEDYFKALVLRFGKRKTDVETVFTLRKEKNAQGIDYAQVVFSRGNDLEPADAKAALAYARAFEPVIKDDPYQVAYTDDADDVAESGWDDAPAVLAADDDIPL